MHEANLGDPHSSRLKPHAPERMSFPIRALLGLFTFTPPVMLLALFVIASLPDLRPWLESTAAMACGFGVVQLGFMLLLFYLWYLAENPRIQKQRKILWGAALALGNIWVFPVYWLLHVWSAPRVITMVADDSDFPAHA